MMKSFFKKLAFVMALAMVVSMVAPAGAAYAAEAGITLQGTKTVVTEYNELKKAGDTVDFAFEGAPKDWKTTFAWTSSDETVATVSKAGVVTAVAEGTATITLTAGADKSYEHSVVVTIGEKEKADELVPQQKTHNMVQVTFNKEHEFDATGADANGNTVKVYRVFSTDEMANMGNKNGLKFDDAGNGYQAYYVMNTTKVADDAAVWAIEGYNAFVDGARYAVVYGDNETSSTINGVIEFFIAYVGKVDYIKVTATEATVENEVEPAIAAKLTTKLYNSHDIDLTGYYKNDDETDYELLDETDVEASVSGDEVTFDEPGMVMVKGTYTYYDEDLEEDVTKTDETPVYGRAYTTYRVDSIYAWSLAGKDGKANIAGKPDWSSPYTSMIAGDQNQLYVIVKDNRGNYVTNYAGIGDYKIGGKKVEAIGNEDTAFEQYGYELVFDSLDPDSLLVDPDGVVDTYKKTNSFAVVSYRSVNDENAKLREIGVMGITVTEPRRIDDVVYNKTSFTILAETETEDGETHGFGFYDQDAYKDDFKLREELKRTFKNQYGEDWGPNAEDWNEADTGFTVTTTKDFFDDDAERIAEDLNDGDPYIITPAMFTGSGTTSVSFKIKENATGDSTTITIKLDKPKYETDGNGNATDVVFVDPTRAVANAKDVEMYLNTATKAKLFQVSKANQEIGYFRIGTLENADEQYELNDEMVGRSYYVANDLTKNFVQKVVDGELEGLTFVSSASDGALTDVTELKTGDYVLVVTDPQGRVFPSYGEGGNGKSFGSDSKLGIVPTADGTAYELIVAAERTDAGHEGEMEYAANGNYRATVYKITSVVENKNTDEELISVKYNTARVSSDSFTVSKTQKNVTFYHQEKTKDVDLAAFGDLDDVLYAIDKTMTFKINGANLYKKTDEDGNVLDGVGEYHYKSLLKVGDNYVELPVVLEAAEEYIDATIQKDDTRAVVNTVTFKVYTPAGGYYLSKVKVNRSVNAAE